MRHRLRHGSNGGTPISHRLRWLPGVATYVETDLPLARRIVGSQHWMPSKNLGTYASARHSRTHIRRRWEWQLQYIHGRHFSSYTLWGLERELYRSGQRPRIARHHHQSFTPANIATPSARSSGTVQAVPLARRVPSPMPGGRRGPAVVSRLAAEAAVRQAPEIAKRRRARKGTRTPDPVLTMDVLYQLSYPGSRGPL